MQITGPVDLNTLPNIRGFAQVGSTVICPDHVTPDSDVDWLVLADTVKDYTKVRGYLESAGCVEGGNSDYDNEGQFCTFKISGGALTHNYLLFGDVDDARTFLALTAVCKRLGLSRKEDRVFVFKAVMDQVVPADLEVPFTHSSLF